MSRKNRLSFWRKVRGLSQSDLAQLIGVTYVTISNWERDETLPTKSQVARVAGILGVKAQDLYPFEQF
ncbi:MAG: Helix-turn-helix domain [Symbiobacteriaceae bacterium]|jgi:transcriptional regulator with XRE-family HTH domain|nr:Helix-turn-helix domain [Symbiobacteriaceae bacterium]